MTYVRRKIDVTITLGTGDFGEGTGNTVKLSGLRVSATITKYGASAMDEATCQIYGLPKSIINQVVRLGAQLDERRNNTITIEAGDDVAGMSTVFSGNILTSFGDFAGAPETNVTLSAQAGAFDLAKPATPLSFPGGADVAVILAQIAATMTPPRTVQNNGVTVHLSNAYLPGTALDQVRAVAKAANINYALDGDSQLVIWPANGSRSAAIPLISSATGMVGYPRYADSGVGLTAIYSPSPLQGALFALKSSSSPYPYDGNWRVLSLIYSLESETPNGKWFMDIVGEKTGVSQ